MHFGASRSSVSWRRCAFSLAIGVAILAAGCLKKAARTPSADCPLPCGDYECCGNGLSCNADAGICDGQFQLVGTNPLYSRGMNSAIAVAGNYVYIGSRTEGETHDHAGVLIVDATDPTQPNIVGEIGPPDEALLGMSSRELRALPDRNELLVLNFSCSPAIHACTRDLDRFPATGGAAETDNLKIYDITDPVNPKLIGKYDFGTYPNISDFPAMPHEFFLWEDPVHTGRTLVYVTTPPGPPALEVLDISDPTNITRIATWDAIDQANLQDGPRSTVEAMHSLTVSDDGTIAYVAYLGAGFFMLDTSDLANDVSSPHINLITPIENRVDYSPPLPPECHSAIRIPGSPTVLLTDEVYPGELAYGGCPWGWVHMVDITDPTHPSVVGQYKLAENIPTNCTAQGGPDLTSFTSHNPTVTAHLAIITWHAGGLQAVDLSDRTNPVQAGAFVPGPLSSVAIEDPALRGSDVAMWSYPVVKNGLIYVTDIRNGLFILKYTGPYADEVSALQFAEGNSNLK